MTYPFTNIPLPYGYDALEPYIDTKTMTLHHDRHLQTYIDHLNAALKEHPELHYWSLEQLIFYNGLLPPAIQTAVKNNAGGVYNHEFYFSELKKSSEKLPVGALAQAINQEFGSFEKFRAQFQSAGISLFGSGYVWLAVMPDSTLAIISLPNQDTPLAQNLCPILALDVWEHAYYLKHYNKRADYISDWFSVVDWAKADERYLSCKSEPN